MLKKVASMGLVAFFGFSLAANVCSASVPKWSGLVPTRINYEYSDSADSKDGEYIPDQEKEKKEQLKEDEDLKDMEKEAVWGREKK